MTRPRLLDLFCKAGGAGMGYHRAGFDVTGVDLEPQPRYPFAFVQSDALEYLAVHGHEYDAIHASPPCQKFSAMTRGRWRDREHPDLVAPTRALLRAIGKPHAIENVIGAPMEHPLLLCGTMFGLQTREGSQLRRHRLFEVWPWSLSLVPQCQHNDGSSIGVYGGGQHPARRRPATIGVWGSAGGYSVRDPVAHYGTASRREAMGVDWMTGAELAQAIPPAYTEHIGRQLLAALSAERAA